MKRNMKEISFLILSVFISLNVISQVNKNGKVVKNNENSNASGPKKHTWFEPSKIWLDTDGKPINAHAAGILFSKGKYYWFGEIKKGKTIIVGNIQRTDAGGISCYSSTDLCNWKFESVALEPGTKDIASDIHKSKIIERPKVIFNEKTKKFVMWMHIDTRDYSYARAGVATADKPEGPYTYLGSFRPNNQMSRDQTLFKDDNGKAYQFASSENNKTMYINELTDDYLRPSGKFKRIFIDLEREAPAVVKHNNKYFIISSACNGWAPTKAMYAISDSIMGVYKVMGNPCTGKDSDITFYSQSTYILPVEGKDNTYISLFDLWKSENLEDSRYVWLPMHFENDKMIIEWKESWELK